MSRPQHGCQRSGRAAQLEHLALEHVDHGRVDALARRGEHGGLRLVDVLLQRAAHVHVAVDDRVEHGVQHDRRTEVEQVRVALETPPHGLQPAVLAVPHGDDEVRAEEDHHLAGLDDLRGAAGQRLVVVHGLHHGEQGVLVVLELRSLVCVHRVLDGQRVQPEPLGQTRPVAPRPVRACRSRRSPRRCAPPRRSRCASPAVPASGTRRGRSRSRRWPSAGPRSAPPPPPR